MTIYIDPPIWPAHGTVFSHVISDSSLEELHRFAEGCGVSDRAFDRDHYDVPAHRYDALVARGAVPVSGRDLARILSGCGLRVRGIERTERVRRNLRRAWGRLMPQAPGLGDQLLQRWSAPHRSYHSPTHLAAVLRTVGVLERAGELPTELRRRTLLAAWYHDAVYDGVAGEDEEASAELAEEQLDGLVTDAEVAEVGRLVRLTATHTPEDSDVGGAVLTDADLEVLGRDETGYLRYTEQVRHDYAHVPDDAFAAGRAEVLRGLLEHPPLYRTVTGRRLWEAQARANLEAEVRRLTGG
ncbi:DUF4031 domain-containing protein [Nesterenkonia marinintestina]|uniref:DUF4031 domain-containing protein n=1 Tax=Nesterenkonia marinintestina TaxID=2979865 RepID=UPI0021BE1EDD|nr:DUF4031 domain-containing protein [Nesterenkonia sp. GX14115]